MNDCPQVRAKLHEWVDRELDREPAAHVARHVEACPPCAEIARSIQSLKNLVRAKAGAVPVPDRLAARVRDAIALEAGRAGRSRILSLRPARWLAAATLAAAFLIVGLPAALDFLRSSGLFSKGLRSNDLHAQVTDQALNSHLRSLFAEDLPRFRCLSKMEAEQSLSDQLGFAVRLPEFCNVRTCLKGVSIEECDGVRIGKVFYRLDGEEFSLFVVPASMRGGTSLCCCRHGPKLHIYCTREKDYCFTFVTALADQPFQELLEPALRRTIQIHRAPAATIEPGTTIPAPAPGAGETQGE